MTDYRKRMEELEWRVTRYRPSIEAIRELLSIARALLDENDALRGDKPPRRPQNRRG